MPTAPDLAINSLGPCRIDSPLKSLLESLQTTASYVAEDDRVLFHDTPELAAATGLPIEELPGFEPAGPRRFRVMFGMSQTACRGNSSAKIRPVNFSGGE